MPAEQEGVDLQAPESVSFMGSKGFSAPVLLTSTKCTENKLKLLGVETVLQTKSAVVCMFVSEVNRSLCVKPGTAELSCTV